MSENTVALATGKKGSGKTTCIRAIADRCRRLLVADPEGKWALNAGDVEIRSGPALVAHLAGIGALDPAVAFRVVYRDDARQMLTAAPAAAFAVRNCTLCVDELAWLSNARTLPLYFERILQFGRERRINILGTTRRPQEIHSFFYDQADFLWFFHMGPGLGLDRVRKYFPQLAGDLPGLALHQSRSFGKVESLRLFGAEGLDFSARRSHRHPRTQKTPRRVER